MKHYFLNKKRAANKAFTNTEPDKKKKESDQLFKLPAKGNVLFENGMANAVTSNLSSQPVQKKEDKEGNLPDEIQTKMEDAFEEDFSDVKVHQNSGAARDLNAV